MLKECASFREQEVASFRFAVVVLVVDVFIVDNEVNMISGGCQTVYARTEKMHQLYETVTYT